jgi:hypothetical protein
MHVLRTVAVWMGVGVLLGWSTLACGPTAASNPTPTPAQGDPFAVVRATAQAAYASGKAHLDHGEYLQACVDLDTAKTNDPDNDPAITQALGQALQYCLTPAAEATAAPAQARPTLIVATVGAVLTQAAPAPAAAPTARPTSGSTAQEAPASADLMTWRDPQGRFSISRPPDWRAIDEPRSLFGTSVVEFGDMSGRAELDVAVDTTSKAVSPELYAASMELAMQQQVPGYASEQVQPGATAGSPSVRRVFTFTQRDASGKEHQARGFQVTLVKGSTPYIISGSTPAEQFQEFSPTFDQMVQSFQFS